MIYYSFFCLHTKSLLVTPETQTLEPHTKSAKPCANSLTLTQFHKTLFAKHNTILYVHTKIEQELILRQKYLQKIAFEMCL